MTDLIIIGAGAGGLMAAVTAAECGLRTVLLERKHSPGRKLLMCANNRCNLTNDLSVPDMLAAYGAPVNEFLPPALATLPPRLLREWFQQRGLRTSVHKDGKVFPASEKASDVFHFFADQLRNSQLSVVYNTPVETIERRSRGLVVQTANFELLASHVLLATGGVSYPKTGSVGDGQKFAKALGHKIEPYRPGLVGFEVAEAWLCPARTCALSGTELSIVTSSGVEGVTRGEVECSSRGIRGPAVVDASRIVARLGARKSHFSIDLAPRSTVAELTEQIATRLSRSSGNLAKALEKWLLPAEISAGFVRQHLSGLRHPQDIAVVLKAWKIQPLRPRPLKEAMVTIGGVALAEVDAQSLESRVCPGLHFCGEVLDIDGPTGGFNLHAAFATARQAVLGIAARRISRSCSN